MDVVAATFVADYGSESMDGMGACVFIAFSSALLQQLSVSALTKIMPQIAPSTILPHSKTKSFQKARGAQKVR